MDIAGNYARTDVSSLEQKELESRALIRTASALNKVRQNWENEKQNLDEALEKDRKLWVILASAMHEPDCPLPVEIKKNILNLAMFIFKRIIDIQTTPSPEKLDVLININMNIAKGLSGNIEQESV